MTFTGHNPSSIPENQFIGLFGIIYRAFGDNMAGLSLLVKDPVADF